jgi:hypothetical protein
MLWHHALRDLLQSHHTQEDENLVDWALRYESEAEIEVAEAQAMHSVESLDAEDPSLQDIVQRVDTILDMPSVTHAPYALGIREPDSVLLSAPGNVSPPPSTTTDLRATVLPMQPVYNIFRTHRMFPLVVRILAPWQVQLKCDFLGCGAILSMEELAIHWQFHHYDFEQILDPWRMVCSNCQAFVPLPTSQCQTCQGDTLVEKLYAQLPEELSFPPPGDAAMTVEPSEYDYFPGQYPLQGLDPSSELGNDGFGFADYPWDDSAMNNG